MVTTNHSKQHRQIAFNGENTLVPSHSDYDSLDVTG
jgi:hypothetical protein